MAGLICLVARFAAEAASDGAWDVLSPLDFSPLDFSPLDGASEHALPAAAAYDFLDGGPVLLPGELLLEDFFDSRAAWRSMASRSASA